ncbi:hypothetical protein J1N35_037573, partial [Gossypium stocksii]
MVVSFGRELSSLPPTKPKPRRSKRILDPPSGFVPNDCSVDSFGFDFVKDDYKVVK